MVRLLLIIAIAFTFGCGKDSATTGPAAEKKAARRPEMDEFFVTWLKAHKHDDVVVDADGVGIANNPTRLQASLYGSKKHEKGGFVVELEFTVRLASGRTITEFVAGGGDTEEKAINEAMLNFTLTTFHVVYKAFLNADDPHMKATTVAIGGVNREVIAGDILMRGVTSNELDLNPMRAEIQGVLKSVSLAPGPHWIKIVYGQNDSKPVTVAVTLDNNDHPKMTNAVTRLKWPRRKGVYMAKQFIVIK